MTRKGKLLSALAGTLVILAACDGSDGVLGNPQAQFGSLFETAFNAGPNADPQDDPDLAITFGGVDGVDLDADPLDV